MAVSDTDLDALEEELANPLGDYGRCGVVHDAVAELRLLRKTAVRPDDIDTRPIRKPPPEHAPVMEYTGAMRIYFNRLSAEPMMWCVSPEDAAWEIAVQRVSLEAGAVAVTVWRQKTTPDDEDGRPSAWIAASGHLRIYADGTATVSSA